MLNLRRPSLLWAPLPWAPLPYHLGELLSILGTRYVLSSSSSFHNKFFLVCFRVYAPRSHLLKFLECMAWAHFTSPARHLGTLGVIITYRIDSHYSWTPVWYRRSMIHFRPVSVVPFDTCQEGIATGKGSHFTFGILLEFSVHSHRIFTVFCAFLQPTEPGQAWPDDVSVWGDDNNEAQENASWSSARDWTKKKNLAVRVCSRRPFTHHGCLRELV